MDEIIASALDSARSRGAQYADLRIVHNREERIVVRNGVVETLSSDESVGLGIRALFDGSWGFASTRDLTVVAADRAAGQAVQIARASARHNGTSRRVAEVLGTPVSSQGEYTTPVGIDPATIALDDKLRLLLTADSEMAAVEQVSSRIANLIFIREDRTFANTEGALVTQTIHEAGGGIQATAVGDGEIQRRSYPQSHGRQQGCAGWEFIVAMDLPGNARRTAEEAAELLTAEPCPTGITTDLIIDSSQLALQIHESCGHAVELDRALGDEAAFAGTSFLTPDLLHGFQYGSEQVNITGDSTSPTGLGTFGWDDEGLPAQSTDIIRNGEFVGYLMSRESATRLGLPSNGCMRAASWNRIPLIRMTNVSLLPGEWALDDLIADTNDGIYLETNRSWSIDDRRYNFQFGTEVGREIKHGKLGRLLRNCTYTGITPEFWQSCDAICGPASWQLWGTPRCGKGQPGQIAHTSHGTSPARFRDVRVGVMG
jgi:TldD protein